MKYIILTRLRYYLIFCDVQRIQLGIQLSLYFCENFHKKSELDTVWLVFGGISHVSKIMSYKIWRSWSKCFQDFSFSITTECLTVCFICFIPQKENIKMKMLNFSLTTVFILEVVAASKSSCSLVFCGKSDLRLTLFHSKYIEHRKIAKIRTQRRVNFPLLSFSATT